MGFNPKDAIESVRDIATNAVEKSADIVALTSVRCRGRLSRE